MLRKRSLIEAVNDQQKNTRQIEHTRHRCFPNYLINLLSALLTFSFFYKKSSINTAPEFVPLHSCLSHRSNSRYYSVFLPLIEIYLILKLIYFQSMSYVFSNLSLAVRRRIVLFSFRPNKSTCCKTCPEVFLMRKSVFTLRRKHLRYTDMKKIFFAIAMMAAFGIASAAESPAKEIAPSPSQDGGQRPPASGCVFSPCQGKTVCGPQFANGEYAANYLSWAEYPCDAGWKRPRMPQGPPPPRKQ